MGLWKGVRWLRRGGWVGAAVCAAAALLCTVPVAASGSETPAVERARNSRHAGANATLTPWEQAEKTREDLEAVPEAERTRAEYTRAMDAYREIYHDHPGDLHAAASVYSVAELLAEQGRTLRDPRSLKAAIGQYEFLRKQYPGSSLRVQALLNEGQIAQNDLSDPGAARTAYELLLTEHPRSSQAEEARAGLFSLDQVAGGRAQGAASTMPSVRDVGAGKAVPGGIPPSEPGRPAETARGGSGSGVAVDPVDGTGTDRLPQQDMAIQPLAGGAGGPKRPGKRAVVTGIRHWSTPTYTRVAIDLGDTVTYEAARVPNPDRIYFDLHGTRLAPELVGKSFAVADDGFLKNIRAAQFSDDMTRIVLDVNDVTEYSAFLLPNPSRLIIDIHGKVGSGATGQSLAAEPGRPSPTAVQTTASRSEVPAPHAAGVMQTTPAKPVPNTVAVKQANTAEVAAVSDLPGKVEATSSPTSQPISAVVKESLGSAVTMRGPQNVVSGAAAPASTAVAGDAIPRRAKKTGKASTAANSHGSATPARAAVPTADGETSLVRALGLKIGRIVIDAGHGGHDSGTLGVDGLEEKDVVLDVALRLGTLLHDRLGAEVIYTRSDDTFIPLETRTAIANKAQADLFLSIHANSSNEPAARGVETYYLNFTSDASAIETAARENAVSDQSIHQLSDLVKKIALKEKIEESREFAADVEMALYGGLAKGNAGLKDRGVKKAPFVVLIGANMPSILAEISFVTNPRDAEELRNPEYRERVAESLYRGVARYEGGLSGSTVPVERAAAGQ